jgi:hypothetical protein
MIIINAMRIAQFFMINAVAVVGYDESIVIRFRQENRAFPATVERLTP